MSKKQRQLLKLFAVLFILFLSSVLVTHYLSPSIASSFVEEKWFKQEIAITDNPWSRKKWQRLQLITEPPQTPAKPKTILLWTKFFGAVDYVPELSDMCPVPKCHVTSNRDFLNTSHAVIFHLRDMDLKDLPQYRSPSQIWLLLHHESPPHTPDFLHRLNSVFNWTATYRFDSDIILTPVVVKKQTPEPVKHVNNFAKKRKMIAWFASNCETPGNREGFVQELRKSIPVDVYGACGTLSCLPKMSDECFVKAGNIYRFYLSFENSICKDYVTEKLFNILNTNMIPVVFGGANYSMVAPPSSYIEALFFKSPKDLANYLLKVAVDEKLYNSYFDWKSTHEIRSEHYACTLCKMLHEPISRQKFYPNISDWWFGDANCRSWPF